MISNIRRAVIAQIGEREYEVRYEALTELLKEEVKTPAPALAEKLPPAVLELLLDQCDKGLPN